jgi:hypothetical protein
VSAPSPIAIPAGLAFGSSCGPFAPVVAFRRVSKPVDGATQTESPSVQERRTRQASRRARRILAKDGINKSNTLFLFTSDEGDHFVGAKPLNAGCDGVTVACTYDPSKIGEIDANLQDLLRAETREHDSVRNPLRLGAGVLHQRRSRRDRPYDAPARA